MSNSSLVSYTKISPNRNTPRNHKIDTITIHCYVGQASVESMGAWFGKSSAQASCNYGIGSDGRIGMFVEEKDRSWCSSSSSNDNRAITIECASDRTDPYAINDKVYKSLIKLCADICKRNGIKELKWRADKSLIGQVDKQNMTVHRWFKNKACVPTYTEVLTRGGWVPITDIEIGDEIACADLDNLRITFEEVYDVIPVREQDTYTNSELTATKDHRMVYSYQQSKDIYKIEDFKHLLRDGTQVYIPLAGHSDFKGLQLTDDMLKFLIAVQADGHYMYDIRKADGCKHNYGVEFHLKKPRKIERIIEIIEEIGFDYRTTKQSDGSVKVRIYNQADTNIVDDVCEKYLNNKCFTWEWINLSPVQAKLFLNEILLWDGCIAADLFTSKERINLDIVNAIAALNGVGSRVFGCNVQFRNSPYITLGENTKRHNRQHNTRYTTVTCVSVKTGIFLIRQDGKTFIIGNCPGEYIYSRLGKIASEVNVLLGVSGGSTSSSTSSGSSSSTSNSTGVTIPKAPFQVSVIIDNLNYRSKPSMRGTVLGVTKKGTFTITEVSNGWGKLKSGAGWIYLENKNYCKILGTVANTSTPTSKEFKVKVKINNLRIRKGPGTNYEWTGKYTGAGIFTIVEERSGWGKLKSGAGWISLSYATKI